MLRNVPTLYNRIYDWEPFVCNSIWLFIGTGECDGNSAVIKIIGTRDRAPASHFCYPPDNKRFHPSTRIRPPLVSPFFAQKPSPGMLFDQSSDQSLRDLEILQIFEAKSNFIPYYVYKCFSPGICWINDPTNQFDEKSIWCREIWKNILKDIIQRYSLWLDRILDIN